MWYPNSTALVCTPCFRESLLWASLPDAQETKGLCPTAMPSSPPISWPLYICMFQNSLPKWCKLASGTWLLFLRSALLRSNCCASTQYSLDWGCFYFEDGEGSRVCTCGLKYQKMCSKVELGWERERRKALIENAAPKTPMFSGGQRHSIISPEHCLLGDW